MQVLRNVFRRKLRVFLTISGITIGVLALVVMGSMAEKINMLVSGGTKYFSDKVTVQAANTSLFSSSPLSLSKYGALKAVPGVNEVSASLSMLLCVLLGSAASTFLLHRYVFALYVIRGSSMAPTLSDGDTALVNMMVQRVGHPERGEMTTFG